ncbi:hypothetical protein T439DRAFT_382022 [Meredithblackwellia eburnea MCA 4105]
MRISTLLVSATVLFAQRGLGSSNLNTEFPTNRNPSSADGWSVEPPDNLNGCGPFDFTFYVPTDVNIDQTSKDAETLYIYAKQRIQHVNQTLDTINTYENVVSDTSAVAGYLYKKTGRFTPDPKMDIGSETWFEIGQWTQNDQRSPNATDSSASFVLPDCS